MTNWSLSLLHPIVESLTYNTKNNEKKKKSHMNALNLHKICCFLFPLNNEHKLLLQTIQYTERKHKSTEKKLSSQTDYKNHDIYY